MGRFSSCQESSSVLVALVTPCGVGEYKAFRTSFCSVILLRKSSDGSSRSAGRKNDPFPTLRAGNGRAQKHGCSISISNSACSCSNPIWQLTLNSAYCTMTALWATDTLAVVSHQLVSTNGPGASKSCSIVKTIVEMRGESMRQVGLLYARKPGTARTHMVPTQSALKVQTGVSTVRGTKTFQGKRARLVTLRAFPVLVRIKPMNKVALCFASDKQAPPLCGINHEVEVKYGCMRRRV